MMITRYIPAPVLAIGAGKFTARNFFIFAIVVAMLSVPLNIIDLPVNLILLFIITVLNGFIAFFLLFANLFIAVAINFPLLVVELIVQFLIGIVNSVIGSIIANLESFEIIAGETIVSFDESKYIIENPSFPRVSLLSFTDAMIKFQWDFAINPWNGSSGGFVVNAVTSGLPASGIWQIAIVPTFKKIADVVTAPIKSIASVAGGGGGIKAVFLSRD